MIPLPLVSCDAFALVPASCDVDSIVNGTIAFLNSRWSKWGATWVSCTCNTVGISNGIMLIVLSITLLHFAFLRSWQLKWGTKWLFRLLMPFTLVSVSHYASSILNSTITVLRSRWSKWGATLHFRHVMPLALASASHHANGIVNCTTAFLRSTWSKWHVTWLFRSCDNIGTSFGIIWYWQHRQWHHYIPYVWMIKMRSNMTFLVIYHWYQCQCHMLPMVSSIASLNSLGQDYQNDVNMTFLVMWSH